MRQHVVLVFLISQAACNAAPSAGPVPQAVCFDHVGSQDKPMPAFCVVHAAPVDHAAPLPAMHEAVLVGEPAFADILLACASARPQGQSGAAGTYQCTRGEGVTPNLLGPDAMTRVGETIRRDAAQRRAPLADVIARLLRRLEG